MRGFVTILLTGLLIAGCETGVSAGGGESALMANDWSAASIAGKHTINPDRVTLSFAEGRVSGRSGCNLYSGPVEIGRGTLKIVGPLISTKMACMGDGLMQQESAYLGALQAAQTYTIDAGKLTIATGVGTIVYNATPRQPRSEN